jgi:uncharacterized protein YegJ (DUF2314 family)
MINNGARVWNYHGPMNVGRFNAILICCCVAALSISAPLGCEQRDPAADRQAARPDQHAKPSLWRNEDGATVIGVEAEAEDRELLAAIAEARRTAPEARKRWEIAAAEDRARWSIKWAAPTIDQGIEHVWVRPVNWSPFRIEGVLLSSPIHELGCGKTKGEIVSFPIEELSDWVHLTGESSTPGTPPRNTEGGFSEKVLEKRFGKPK